MYRGSFVVGERLLFRPFQYIIVTNQHPMKNRISKSEMLAFRIDYSVFHGAAKERRVLKIYGYCYIILSG